MRKRKFLFVFVLVAVLLNAGPGVVLADDPPPGAVERRPDDLLPGPPVDVRPGEPPPGAVVRRVQARPLGGDVQSLGGGMRTSYRSGWTGCWYEYHWPADIIHVGSHTSASDLVEDEIKVDGFMKIKTYWDDSCRHPTSGKMAHCNTRKVYHIPYTFYAESHHFFHKAGYQDDYFETSKTYGL
jgi:hypothetical protein